ncbi:MAG: hypothetical protein J7513_12695, partial [Solirubrobacteraceae bacterium]|nr:hypothetical protein [Solirubrobacteraceae bacterium]
RIYTSGTVVRRGRGPVSAPVPTPPPSLDRAFNFGPAGTPAVAGYTLETGSAWDASRGYGWVRQDSVAQPSESHVPYSMEPQTRDRNKVADQRIDTLIQLQPTTGDLTKGAWELAVPDGQYTVTVSAGDASYVNSVHTVRAEGQKVLDGVVPTTASLFASGSATVTVADGRLTIDGIGGTNVKLNWIRVRSVLTGGGTPSIAVASTQAAAFPDRVVFNRFQQVPSDWPTVRPLNSATVRLRNTGSTPADVTAITTSDPTSFAVDTPPAGFPIRLAPGESADVNVRFTYSDPSRALVNGESELRSGDLIVTAQADTTVEQRIGLRGWWQSRPERGTEPSLANIVNGMFGFGTTILKPGQTLRNNGRIETVGDEVLGPYWSRRDPTRRVRVTQLAAFHGSGNTESVYWYERGAPDNARTIGVQTATDAQRPLPAAIGGSGQSFVTSFAPVTSQFGFRVAGGEWSDPLLNSTGQDMANGCLTNCGHHVRFWPAKDRTGAVIPGAYLMTMDYASVSAVNYDFEDNVYLLENVEPAASS